MDNKALVEALCLIRAECILAEDHHTSKVLSQAADALEACSWRDVDEFTEYPQRIARDVIKETAKGPRNTTEFTPNEFLAQSKCGKILKTHVMQDGRLVGFAKGENPVRIFTYPTPPVVKE